MLSTTVNLDNSRVTGNSNLTRFELILQCGLTKCTALALTPGEDLTIIAAKEAHVATASNAADVAHRNVFDEHG